MMSSYGIVFCIIRVCKIYAFKECGRSLNEGCLFPALGIENIYSAISFQRYVEDALSVRFSNVCLYYMLLSSHNSYYRKILFKNAS